ncbi:hypothetical protein MIR68_010655 [Amoeboaphelidium protococcarum]|nr:hypothetical protein MIR68_010655 [Amoeboaphelidium protococcarum]
MASFDDRPLYVTAIITVCYQLTYFFIAYFAQIDKVTDFAGASNFLINAVVSLGFAASNAQNLGTFVGSKKIVASLCVVVWAVRLGLFLLTRVLKAGDDKRFDEMREKFFSFLGFWVFQMLWVYIVGLSVVLMNSLDEQPQFGSATDIAGLVIFIIGFVIEAVADQHKFYHRFNYTAKYKQEHDGQPPPIIQTGMWRFSRQPNYFGEIFLWWGIFVMCLSQAYLSTSYIAIISPIFITLLLLFLSGIPLAEKGSQKRYLGSDNADLQKNYYDYRQRTSPLILMPPFIYKRLPLLIKRIFFFEWTIYESEYLSQANAKFGSGSSSNDNLRNE